MPILRWPRLATMTSQFCTASAAYGFAARAILKHFCANEPRRLRSIGARFSHHVFPGETLQTEIWALDERELHFQTRALERNAVVLSNGRARFGA